MNEWIDNSLQFDELIQIVRIFLAIVLGAVIGFEREKYGRPAGLRTHIIVCVASTLAMLVSIFGFESGDPARLAAQVISGIGFIGAGTIIRGDKDITGITTAATIWICSIIGLACGNGYYFGAIITTVLVLVVLSSFTKLEIKLSKSRKRSSNLSVIVKNETGVVDKLKDFLNHQNIAISTLEYKNQIYEGDKVIKITVGFEKHTKVNELNNFLADLDKEFSPLQCKITSDSIVKNKGVRE